MVDFYSVVPPMPYRAGGMAWNPASLEAAEDGRIEGYQRHDLRYLRKQESRLTCPCCEQPQLHQYMLRCERCQARDIARMPESARNERLSENEHLRELAREEFRADMRRLRGIDGN